MSKKAFRSTYLFVSVLAFLLSSCSSMNPAHMAKINDYILTKVEFKKRMGDYHTIKDIGSKMADAKILVADYDRMLQEVIDERLMIQEAKRVGFRGVARYKNSYEATELNIFVELLKTDEIRDKVVVPEEEIRAKFVRQYESVKLQHIFIKNKEKGERVFKELQEGAKFDDLVEKESEDPPALIEYKGNLGFRTRQKLKKKLADAAFSLEIGQTSDLIESSNGFHILKIKDKKQPGEIQKYDRNRIFKGIFKKKAKVRENEFIASLKEKSSVSIDETVFEKIQLKKIEKGSNPVLFTINGANVPVSDYFNTLKNISKGNRDPDPEQIQEALDTLIAEKLFQKEAMSRDYHNDPRFKVLMSELTDIIYLDYFQNYMVAELSNLIPSEVKEYYEKNKEKFKRSKQVKLRVIHLSDMDLAKTIIADVQSGGDFGIWAKEESIDKPSALKGGKLGWLDVDKMPPEIKSDYSNWKVAGVYGPYKIAKDIFVVKLEEERDGTYRKYKEVKKSIIREMLKFKYERNMTSYLGELRRSAKISINKKQLAKYFDSKRRVFEEK